MRKPPNKQPGKEQKVQKPLQPATAKPFNDTLWAVILFFFAFALYANSIPNGYVLDDYNVIYNNVVVHKGISGIPTILNTPYRYGSGEVIDGLYRPFSLFMFALEWQISPKYPALHHFFNVFFYAFSCSLLFILLRKIFALQTPLLALFASLLWLAHPIHTEVVANIKSRDEIMSVFFLLLAFLGFIRYLKDKNRLNLVLAVLLYSFSLFSKEGVITCLLIFPLAGWYVTGKFFGKNILASSLMLIPVIGYLLMKSYVFSNYPVPSWSSISIVDNFLVAAPDLGVRMATAIILLGKYLLLLVVPYQLVSDYSYNQIHLVGWTNPFVIISFLIFTGMLVYAILKIRTRSVVVFGILFYLISMSIYSNIFKLIGSSFGERFLFLPSVGFCILFAWLLLLFIGKEKKSSVPSTTRMGYRSEIILPFGLLMIILVFYSVKTVARNAEWESPWTLFSNDVKRSPLSAHMHCYFGMTLRDRSKELTDPDECRNLTIQSIAEFKKAIEIYPGYFDCQKQLGLAYFRIGELDESLKNYQESLKRDPYPYCTYIDMGKIYFQKGERLKALELFRKAISANPSDVEGYYNVGSIYGMLKEYDKAIENYKKCIEIKPDYAPAYYYIGKVYTIINQKEVGKIYLQKAYQLDPSVGK
jgi:protein O-mannosyl-transferase